MSSNLDGTPHASTDPDGGVTTYGYNSLNQLAGVTPPASGSLTPVQVAYDGFGRVSTVKDGNGNTLTYTYGWRRVRARIPVTFVPGCCPAMPPPPRRW